MLSICSLNFSEKICEKATKWGSDRALMAWNPSMDIIKFTQDPVDNKAQKWTIVLAIIHMGGNNCEKWRYRCQKRGIQPRKIKSHLTWRVCWVLGSFRHLYYRHSVLRCMRESFVDLCSQIQQLSHFKRTRILCVFWPCGIMSASTTIGIDEDFIMFSLLWAH